MSSPLSPLLLDDYKIEIILFTIFTGLLIDFIFKAQKVQEKSLEISQKFNEILDEEFSHVQKLTRNSPHEYLIYSSGRKRLDSLLITLAFKQSSLLPPAANTQVLKDTIKVHDKKKRWDIDQMTSALSFSGLKKEKYVVFGDNLQVFSLLLQDMEIKTFLLEDSREILEEFSSSDCAEKKPSKIEDMRKDRQTLTFAFKMIQDLSLEQAEKIMNFVLRVVDVLSLMELSKDTTEKIQRSKRLAEESVLKQSEEEIQSWLFKRKVQEKKKREEARMTLSKEEARKAEEKEKKRDLKKSQKKMMKKGKVVMR